MKRNKHTNVVSSVKDATTHSNKVAADRESTELIMKDSNGKLIKAEGVVLSPEFIKLSERLMKEKGVSKESAEAIAKSVTVWTPDMVGKDIEEDTTNPKKVTKKKTTKPKAEKKPAKAKKETTSEEKPKKPRKKKTEA